MKIKKITAENILSIESAELEFGEKDLVLISGWNYDDDKANGAGKTAILNAISFGLYGKLPRNITVTDILREGANKGKAKVDLEIDGVSYSVVRERPNKLTFLKEQAPITMTQQEFERLIGLDYDQFLIAMYTAQNTSDKFISLNDTGKKDFLLRLLKLTDFSKCKKMAESALKALESDKIIINNELCSTKASIEAYSNVNLDPEQIQRDIDDKQNKKEQLKEMIERLSAVKRPDLSKYRELGKQLQLKKIELSTLRHERSSLMERYAEVVEQLGASFTVSDHDAECPKCKEKLVINGKSIGALGDVKVLEAMHKKEKAELEEKRAALKAQIDSIDLSLKEESRYDLAIEKLDNKRLLESKEYDSAQERMSNARIISGNLGAEIQGLMGRLDSANKTQQTIKALLEKSGKLQARLSEIQTKAALNEQLSSMFSSTGIPAYLLDSLIDALNEAVSKYVDIVWQNARYEIRSFKEKADGDVTSKFSELLTINGKPRGIGSLSGGEYKVLSIAIDLAIIDVLANNYGLALNPIFLDEPFNDLDATSKETVMEMLKTMAVDRQLIIIDHSSETKSMFSKVILIEKRGGVSRIS